MSSHATSAFLKTAYQHQILTDGFVGFVSDFNRIAF
jgi:hypothetical protein